MEKLPQRKSSATNSQASPEDLVLLKCTTIPLQKKAIAELVQATVEGRTVKVMEAKPKEDRPARSNSPFRNDNGGYKKSKW